MKRLGFYIPLVIFTSVVLYMAIGLTLDPSKLPSTLIDKPAPEFDLGAIDGQSVGFKSEDLLGQVSLINYWGSWCEGCVYEHPILMEIAKRGLVPIFGIDWKDPPGEGMKWLNENGNPYALIGDDPEGRTAIDFGITGAPETFIVDKEGRIRLKYVGPITPEAWEKIIYPMIKELRK